MGSASSCGKLWFCGACAAERGVGGVLVGRSFAGGCALRRGAVVCGPVPDALHVPWATGLSLVKNPRFEKDLRRLSMPNSYERNSGRDRIGRETGSYRLFRALLGNKKLVANEFRNYVGPKKELPLSGEISVNFIVLSFSSVRVLDWWFNTILCHMILV